MSDRKPLRVIPIRSQRPPSVAATRNLGVGASERENRKVEPEQMGTSIQSAAALIGIAFLGIGIFGFIPGLTTEPGGMTFAGHESRAQLFGIFEVSGLHNIVHLLFGAAGLVSVRTWSTARRFLVAGGLVYLVFSIYGVVVHSDSAANFVPFNNADNWLHLGLGLGMISLGLLLDRGRGRLRAGTGTMGG